MLLCKCVVLVFYNLVLSTSTWFGLYVKTKKREGENNSVFTGAVWHARTHPSAATPFLPLVFM